ncbi:hypothetical protein HMPREF0298_1919 [Corynebacterium lipophiloflavum DSM 44291]|uniref:4Fe-4S Wbl-type domain-containing protein n=1 Tax=Corynebacterium lipophiloflavum (strain ATCC 700352 / DSM 44291 / CCUG 37336 / JCM 10383 / DMMZ 1944) TaxID=525263 RepID=C0XTZ9_CORLD|nr:hypothetical protein HMPREF0298_1919 [Corynebacterium lipophiloflavum DSM 44291]
MWDGRRPKEPTQQVHDRHTEAKLLCRRCPLLTACERALSDLERAGLHVDGVMAGRYSDVRSHMLRNEAQFHQTTCRGCAAPLIPQGGVGAKTKPPPKARRHIGEGLCEDCYPVLAILSGKRPAAPPRSHQQNNPTGLDPHRPAREPDPRHRREVG